MSAPNLTITVEPNTGSAVMFLPLAPKSANDPVKGEIAVMLTIRNNGPATIDASTLTVSFPGFPAQAASTIPLGLTIGAGATAEWNFQKANEIVIPQPGPGTIRFSVACTGFTDPAVTTLPLVAAGAPVAGGFDFPARASDLRLTEYWQGQSLTHDSGAAGSQLFAYDMGVIGLDPASHAFNGLLPGTSGKQNTDFRIWGKPLHAIADGTVLEAENSVPNNPAPLPGPTAADFAAQFAAQAAAVWNKPQFKNPGAGNHFYLQHGDHVVLYAHMQHGSLNPVLLATGAVVKRGDFLGLAGNAGNSSGPHLHVHAIKGNKPETGPLRPFPFRDTWVVDTSTLTPPNPAGPWVQAKDQGLPAVGAAIWPAASKPAWYPPGWPEIVLHGIPDANFQTEFNKATGAGYRMVWVDGFDVGGKTFFNMIFHPADGTEWEAHVGLNATDYQTKFDTLKAAGFRPIHVETFLNGGNVLFAGIWAKTGGPAYSAYHGKSAAEHQALFNTLFAQGFAPTTVSAVETSGGPCFTGLYEKRNVGGLILSGLDSFPAYQTQTDANIAAGRNPASLNAVSNGNNPLMIGLWEQDASVHFVARHGQTAGQFQTEYDSVRAQGFLTRAISGCDDGNGNALFATIWSK
jgi:hypothetical protein